MGVKQKLLLIQNELKAPKSQFNSFGKYSYRNCEDIMEALKPLCKKHNAVVTITDDINQVGERYYIKATVTIRDCDIDESLTVTAFAREEESKKGMDGSQVTGASSSYARKYALNGLFAIDDTKDADSGIDQSEPKQEPKKEPIKQKTRTELILQLIKDSDITPKDIATKLKTEFNKSKVDELTQEQFDLFYNETKEAVNDFESKLD